MFWCIHCSSIRQSHRDDLYDSVFVINYKYRKFFQSLFGNVKFRTFGDLTPGSGLSGASRDPDGRLLGSVILFG